MARKTTTKQIIVALHKVVEYDMQTFFYKLSTGRLINDARIVAVANCGTIGEFVRSVSDYGMFDHETMDHESVAALTEAGYITPTSITHAEQIKSLADQKTRIMG